MAGGLTGGTIQNIYGRRRTMFISNIFFILGALLIALTYHQAQFIVGRIIIGYACGLGGVVAPSYLGEVSTIRGRGTMGAGFQLLIVIGILISNLIGLGLSRAPRWRIMFAINGLFPLIQLFLLPSLVESPKWLVSKNRLPEARDALQKLRGQASNIEHEFADMVRLLLGRTSDGHTANRAAAVATPDSAATAGVTQQNDSAFEETKFKADPEARAPATGGSPHNYSISRLFSSECNKLAVIGILVHFFQQATAINGLIYYSTSFLGDVFGEGNSKYITVGTSCCNLVATILSVYLMDKLGRRTLLLISSGGVTISSILLVIGAYRDISGLVVAGVFLFIAFFAVGMGPIPWLLLSELLPTYALSAASSVATAVNWGTNFVIGLVFPSLNDGLGNGTFIIFAALTAIQFVYIWIFVPETKARSIEDIMAERGVAPRSDFM
ncbi:hypothetical protein BX616_004133 [Lobosporangium transversale]|nr:hypothetical protein BX616_004133 [Lobosporangium transversale]